MMIKYDELAAGGGGGGREMRSSSGCWLLPAVRRDLVGGDNSTACKSVESVEPGERGTNESNTNIWRQWPASEFNEINFLIRGIREQAKSRRDIVDKSQL